MLMQASGSWEARMLQLHKLLSASVCTCTVASPSPKEIPQTELPASSVLAASAMHLFRALPWMPTPDSSPVPATSYLWCHSSPIISQPKAAREQLFDKWGTEDQRSFLNSYSPSHQSILKKKKPHPLWPICFQAYLALLLSWETSGMSFMTFVHSS